VLRDGVLFTVVQLSDDFGQTLIYWNQHQVFGSEFRFIEDMTPIQFERADPMGGHLPAYLFMKPSSREPGVVGYTLGIEARDWFWEKVKDSCAAPLGVDANPLTASVELSLATLPLGEFDVYLSPADRWTSEYLLMTAPGIRKRRDEHRERLGWKDMKHPDDLEVHVAWPERIEHKYFTVEHRSL